MFLSGLNNIYFAGIGAIGGMLSPSEAAAIAWDHAPFGSSAFISQSDFTALVTGALSSGGYAITQQADVPGNAVPDSAIISAASTNGALSSQQSGALQSVLSSMRGDGYYVVSTQRARPTSTPAAPAATMGPVAPVSIAYQGAVTAQQVGVPSIQQSFQQNIAQPISAGIQSVVSTVTGRTPLPTIYRRQAYRQTPAERQRLIWIVGGFAVIFALAMGVIASRSGD